MDHIENTIEDEPILTVEQRPPYFCFSSDTTCHIRHEIIGDNMTCHISKKNVLRFASGIVSVEEARSFAKWILQNT